jgi:hypothetical protein
MQIPTPTPEAGLSKPGALVGMLALAIGGLWIVGSVAIAVALIGADRIAQLSGIELGAIAAAAFLPALMVWFAGAAARESAHARAEAARLADAADRLLNPQQSASEAARRVTMNVRGEITSLDQALEHTLTKLREVEGVIARQTQAVDTIAEQAKAGANQMITGMEREREELLRISRDLTNQAHTIGDSISRHTQSISEAARKAEAEVRAADQALDHRLTSFGAAAALINDRTHGLSSAAQVSADSALRLESALSNALDILSKATNLTDAARQSAEAAALAANSTAGAVRDTTARAVDDAKRAAELIRSEAVSVEREAALALERLRDAADAAREAAIGARSAAEEAPTTGRVRNRTQSPAPGYDNSWRQERDPLETPAPARRAAQPDAPAPNDWTWRSLLSSVNETEARRPAVRRETDAPAAPPSAIAQIVSLAGVDLNTAFSPSALERIAQRARSGSQARRRAVIDAAPQAVQQLAQHMAADVNANQAAMEFMRSEGQRIAELLGRGRAAMIADATKAFLLIDAAVS